MAEPIAPVATSLRPIPPVPAPAGGEGPRFADTLHGMLGEVEQAQKAAEEAARAYATGRTTDVTATMIAVERASITLQLMLQVRARLLEAYHELIRMQV